MATIQLRSSELCALAHDLVKIVQKYRHKQHTTLQMHNTCMGEWDEIRVMTVDNTTNKEKPIIKISLAQLTQAERRRLKKQVGLYNETLLSSSTEKVLAPSL